MIHQLNTEHSYFEDVISGNKPFEVRNNDRDFNIGDFLALNELSDDFQHTGRSCLVEVTYVLSEQRFAHEGCVIIGIRPCRICTATAAAEMNYGGGSKQLYSVQTYGGAR